MEKVSKEKETEIIKNILKDKISVFGLPQLRRIRAAGRIIGATRETFIVVTESYYKPATNFELFSIVENQLRQIKIQSVGFKDGMTRFGIAGEQAFILMPSKKVFWEVVLGQRSSKNPSMFINLLEIEKPLSLRIPLTSRADILKHARTPHDLISERDTECGEYLQ